MPTAKTRTWFVPTSPRSPHKLRNELTLLSTFDGCNWWEKDENNKPVNQLRFARLLAQSDFFEGTISERYPDFSARERCRAIWMFGFGYVDGSQILHITPAGRKLIDGIRVEELFLKQMLKWQFPSWQHGGNPATASKYPVNDMDVFPFVETLKIVKEVNGITKKEIAMFLLPCLSEDDFNQATSKIESYRRELQNRRAGLPRKEFTEQHHFEIFREVYREDIDIGDINTRQIPTADVRGFLLKKIRNSIDYADAAIRYFQYTGLFTRSFDKLVLAPHRIQEIDRILNEMDFEIIDYDDVDRYYTHIGNPNLPYFPWENIDDMQERITIIKTQIGEIANEIRVLDSRFSPLPAPVEPALVTIESLSGYFYNLDKYALGLREELLHREARKPEMVSDIVQMYQKIERKEVIDPALFFEWNTWRALLALNDCIAKPNFQIDNELMPLSTAGGGQADIETYYNGDYAVLTEVTLSKGARQYETEGEPVTRHIGEFQASNTDRKVYGLFIAPVINPNTSEYFFVYFKLHPYPNAGHLTIVPLPLQKFIEFLSFCMERRCFNRGTFRQIFGEIENLREATQTSQEWYNSILNIFQNWRTRQGNGLS